MPSKPARSASGRVAAAILVAAILAAGGVRPASAGAPTTAAIQGESLRKEQRDSRLISFWWLPAEYWRAAAREAGQSQAEVRRAGVLTEAYVILAGLDTEIAKTGSITGQDHLEMLERIHILVAGQPVEPLVGRVNPELANMLRELTYVLRFALGPLGGQVRIFLFPNLSDDGKPRFDSSEPGVLDARYRLGPQKEDETLDLRWRSPLTSVVGSRICPEGGERLEASWAFCPRHGVKLR